MIRLAGLLLARAQGLRPRPFYAVLVKIFSISLGNFEKEEKYLYPKDPRKLTVVSTQTHFV